MKLSATTNVDLGDKSRTLVLNMNAMSIIENELNVNLMQDGGNFFGSLDFTKMRVLIWAMLYKEDPRPTLLDVGEWLSEADLEKVSDGIGKLFALDSKGDDAPKRAGKAGKAVDPTKG